MTMRATLLALASTTAILSAPALAQQAGSNSESSGGLDDIVVTAQSRESKLETTPMTINVVSGDQLRAEGIQEIKDLAASVPGMTMNESPGGLPTVSIRGIGATSSSQLFEQSVGLFVDGVYHPRQRQYRDSLFDVERIEVVKGSQGVLFGRNTSVGGVAVITRRPGEENGGYLQVDHELNYGSTNVEGGYDYRFAPNFALRVSGQYSDVNGWVENRAAKRDEVSGSRYVIRTVADWDITPQFNALFKLQWGRINTVGNGFEYITNLNTAGLKAIGVLDGGAENYVKYEAPSAGQPDTVDHQISFDPSLILNYTFDNGYSIKSTTGYSRYSFVNGFDSDNSPQPLLTSQFNENFYQFSQEVRLTSPTGNPIDFILGAIYSQSRSVYAYDSYYNGYPVLGGLYGTVAQLTNQDQHTWAAFANVNWHLTDALTFSVGGRYSSDTKEASYRKALLDDLGRPNGVVALLGRSPLTRVKNTDNTFDFTGTLNYELTPSSTIYVSVGRGNKGAAFSNQAALALAVPNPFLVPRETVMTYEAGIKGRFLDGRAYASLSGFMLDITDLQDSFYNPTARAFQFRSIDAKTRGVEGEARFKVADPITLFGNFAWLPKAEDANGGRLQRAPRFTYTLGVRGDTDLSSDWGLSGFANLIHSSNYLHQPATAAGDNNSLSYSLVNARLELTYRPANLSVFLNANNITKEVYRSFMFGSPTGLGQVGALNEPRTFTVGARVQF